MDSSPSGNSRAKATIEWPRSSDALDPRRNQPLNANRFNEDRDDIEDDDRGGGFLNREYAPIEIDSSSPGSNNPAEATSKSHFRIERPSSSEALDRRHNRPLNRFNLYYIIERERLLQSIDGYQPDEADGPLPPDIVTGYEGLQLPELPMRYRHIEIAHDW